MEVHLCAHQRTMRYKRACREMKILGPRVMSAFQVWLWLLLFIFQNNFILSKSAEPGYLDFDNLPETNFSCAGKVIGGYYADLETDCQMFHVCTIGQLEEPMDIKFLCLNGTVFDQETRVCERVDEVDCSKSEHFYSLNLELYGNTAPPIIKADTSKKTEPDEPNDDEDEEYDIEEIYDEPPSTTKTTSTSTTTTSTSTTTTTKKPITTTTTTRPQTTTKNTYYHTTIQSYHLDSSRDTDDDVYDLIDDNDDNESPVDKFKVKNNTNISKHKYPNSQVQRPSLNLDEDKNSYGEYDLTSIGEEEDKSTDIEDNSQVFNTEDFVQHYSNPHELVRKPPAISFQQQSFPNDGKKSHVTVTTHIGKGNYAADITKTNNPNKNIQLSRTYLTSSTPDSETKSFTDKSFNYPAFEPPKRTPLIPTPTVQGKTSIGHSENTASKQNEPLYFSFRKPSLTPQGFKPSLASSNSQLNSKPNIKSPAKPFQSYQSSERHEVSIDSDFDFDKLSPSFPLLHQDFSQYHYEHKRSQESDKYVPTVTEKRSDTTTLTSKPYYNTWATRNNNNYTKSLPRVIVTASASVSDSNGKKLNYTVGNIVHAVKPLVPTNYDDYKESDVLLDPFFLDVPKLQKNRNKRNSHKIRPIKHHRIIKRRNILMLDARKYYIANTEDTTTIKLSTEMDTPFNTLATESSKSEFKTNYNLRQNYTLDATTQPSHWIPPDYVNDNYEPLTFSEKSVETKSDELQKKDNNDFINFFSNSKFDRVHHTKFPEYSLYPKSEISLNGNIKITSTMTTNPKVISNKSKESHLHKTTTDLSNRELKTNNIIVSNFTSKNTSNHIYNYKLKNVHLVTISEKNSNNMKFSCSGKKYYKFYPDKTDCRTFHLCSPGLSVHQVLDIVFICDLGTYFNSNIVRCTQNKPNDCEQFSDL